MTNFEKYENEIIEVVKNGMTVAVFDNEIHGCEAKCRYCEFYDSGRCCDGLRREWLNSPYIVTSDTTEEHYKEDMENALEWVKKISKYGEYINGFKNWSDNADKYIPILEKAIDEVNACQDMWNY